jgi:hypothetical protein
VLGRGGRPSPEMLRGNGALPRRESDSGILPRCESISFPTMDDVSRTPTKLYLSGKGAPFSSKVAQTGGGGDVSTRGATGRGRQSIGGRSRSGGVRGGRERQCQGKRRSGRSRSGGARGGRERRCQGKRRSRSGGARGGRERRCQGKMRGLLEGRVDVVPRFFFGSPRKWLFRALISGGLLRGF